MNRFIRPFPVLGMCRAAPKFIRPQKPNGRLLIGVDIQKHTYPYYGVVSDYYPDDDKWLITFCDDNEEEMDIGDLLNNVALYDKNFIEDFIEIKE